MKNPSALRIPITKCASKLKASVPNPLYNTNSAPRLHPVLNLVTPAYRPKARVPLRRRGLDAEESNLVLEVLAHEMQNPWSCRSRIFAAVVAGQ